MKIRYFVLSAAVLSSLSVLAQDNPKLDILFVIDDGARRSTDQLVCARLSQGKPIYAMPELDRDGGSYEYCNRVTPADFSRLSKMYSNAKTPEDQAAFQKEAKASIERYGDEYAAQLERYHASQVDLTKPGEPLVREVPIDIKAYEQFSERYRLQLEAAEKLKGKNP
ncbi:hypothetical protein K2X30_00080 [bacterium]|jgi:hypothetical protein|nr:hypothetical protein [bacterium]